MYDKTYTVFDAVKWDIGIIQSRFADIRNNSGCPILPCQISV